MSEIMLHDATKAYGLRFVILRYFNVAGADPRMRTGQATPAATHLIKVACETAIGKRPKLEVFGTDFRHRTAPASAITSMSATWCRPILRRLRICVAADPAQRSTVVTGTELRCLKLSNSVRRASGRDFPVEVSQRRPGDVPALVANVNRIRAMLPWRPQFQNLDTIVAHTLAWEKQLAARRNQREAAPETPRFSQSFAGSILS